MDVKERSDPYYKNTNAIYGKYTWGPIWAQGDGVEVEHTDNNARKYILHSLDIMRISADALCNQTVFNIGSGREARVFLDLGAQFVTHFDIAKDTVKRVQQFIHNHNIQNMKSIHGDIARAQLEWNHYDIIFLAGVYQHIETPAEALVQLINMLKPGGVMYLGFYRTGEWKYFIVDAIRYLLEPQMLSMVQRVNAIVYTFNQPLHYQMGRLLDDFFVPCKHNFHPSEVIHDIELLGAKVFYFDGDFREYQHEGKDYFSIGGDRIYITKEKETHVKVDEVIGRLKTKRGRNQFLEMNYQEDIINENIALIKEIKQCQKQGVIGDLDIVLLALTLYQLTRPFVPEQSEMYQKTMKEGRHITLNTYLKNYLQWMVQREGEEVPHG